VLLVYPSASTTVFTAVLRAVLIGACLIATGLTTPRRK
jgi:hypothetical protein